MTIDRTAQAALVDALRHIAEVRAGLSDRSLPPEAVKRVQDYIDIAIVALHAKDRRITELEAECSSARSGAAEAVAAHDVSKDLFSMVCSERDDALLHLSIATELNVSDRKKIAELEAQNEALQAGLREALDTSLDRAIDVTMYTRLYALLPSEET